MGKGECVQGSSGRPQQEVKERSSVTAPDTEWRLCHPGGGEGRPGGVWRGESYISLDTCVNINAFESSTRELLFINTDLHLLSLLYMSVALTVFTSLVSFPRLHSRPTLHPLPNLFLYDSPGPVAHSLSKWEDCEDVHI